MEAGRALTILGANGQGKSTLCHILAGLTPRYTPGTLRGGVRIFEGSVIASQPPPSDVGLLFQDPATQLFNSTVEMEVAWGLEALAVPSVQIGEQVNRALERFGLVPLRHRAPWALSGGEQRRLALASLWAQRPRVLLLDEPLGGLDPTGRKEVLASLDLLRREGTTLLFTAAYLNGEDLTQEGAFLRDRTLSEPTSLSALRAQPADLGTLDLRHLHDLPAWSGERQIAPDTVPAVAVQGLCYHYEDGPVVLHNIDLTIPRGQFVALMGPNGAGKTTFIRHFNGLLRPAQGQIQVLGEAVAGQPVGALARKVGFLFQRPEQQLFAQTVREEIAFGPRHLNLPDVEARVDKALERFGLVVVADRPPALLGYGVQRSVTLASLSALETPILVLDEPTVGLDGQGWSQLLTWLAERYAAGVTIIAVTHESALAGYADRVVVLERGRITADGSPDEVLPEVRVR